MENRVVQGSSTGAVGSSQGLAGGLVVRIPQEGRSLRNRCAGPVSRNLGNSQVRSLRIQGRVSVFVCLSFLLFERKYSTQPSTLGRDHNLGAAGTNEIPSLTEA